MKHCLRESRAYPPRRILGSPILLQSMSITLNIGTQSVRLRHPYSIVDKFNYNGNVCFGEPYSVICGTDIASITPSTHSRNMHQVHETYLI